MKKKILILYAEYGSGHKSIAKYVANYLIENNKNFEVMILNLSDFSNIAGKIGLNVMKFVSKYRPEKIFDFCYNLSDHRLVAKGTKPFAIRSFDNKQLRRIISAFNPDVCISSLLYCSNIISYYNKIGLIKSKLITIITDYYSHEAWTINHKEEDAFIVSNEIVKNEIVKRGVPRKKVYAFGLPLINDNRRGNKLLIRKKYGINNSKKVILFFGGSTTGSMYYFHYLKILAKINPDVNVIFISGHNEKLQRKAQDLVVNENLNNWVILGYSTDVFNLYRISDLVISKPGGATITECLEFRVPMLLIPGVGGQEKYNAKFIEKNKYGLYAKNKRRFKKQLNLILNNPKILNNINEKLSKQSENNSLALINNLVKKI